MVPKNACMHTYGVDMRQREAALIRALSVMLSPGSAVWIYRNTDNIYTRIPGI